MKPEEREYQPISNRKFVRSVLRSQIIQDKGYHEVSKNVHEYWKKYQQWVLNKPTEKEK